MKASHASRCACSSSGVGPSSTGASVVGLDGELVEGDGLDGAGFDAASGDAFAANADGTLTYAFIEMVKFTYPYYFVRLCGGLLCLTGMVIMAVNVVRTYQLARGPIAIPVLPVPADNAIDAATA